MDTTRLPAPHLPAAGTRRPHTLPARPGGVRALTARRDAEHWRRLAFDAVRAQGLERERIAAGLHDDIGQTLAVAALKLGQLQTLVPAETVGLVAELRALLAEAARATRSATFELSCPLLAQLGLRAALEGVLRRAEAMSATRLRLCGSDPATPLSPTVLGVAFRVARELVHNTLRHAQAAHGLLRLRGNEGGWHITVADDGRGFDVREATGRFGPQGGYGLASALAQVHAVGGRLLLRSRPGRGTVARLWVPARGAEPGSALRPGDRLDHGMRMAR
jgi:signal transduction histidine kinase